jgi:hypothetical protein
LGVNILASCFARFVGGYPVAEESSLTEVKRQQELEVMNAIFQVLNGLDGESRQRVLQTVTTYYQFILSPQRAEVVTTDNRPAGPFSEDRSMSPKIFMMPGAPFLAFFARSGRSHH